MDASLGYGVLKTGYLVKQGEKVKSWRRRYFVLRHDMIQLRFEYYKQPRGEMLGSFELKELKCFRIVEPPNSIFPGCTGMEVDTPSRVYRMTAVSEYELREWAWAVEGSLNYLRQKVADGGFKVSHSGWLLKKGGNRRNWKKRWFQLTEKVLQYSRAKGDKCLGTVMLTQCLAVRSRIDVDCSRLENFLFFIETPAEQENWLQALMMAGCSVSRDLGVSKSVFYQPTAQDSGSDSEDETSRIADDPSGLQLQHLGALPEPIPTAPTRKRMHAVPARHQFSSFVDYHMAFKPLCLTSSTSS